jgi:hypothetical protein
MPTVKPRDQVAPTLQKAQDTLTDTVLPAVRDALAVARDKSVELLDSDAALEAKRRGINVLRAAKGDTVLVATPAKRRFRFGFKTFALIAAAGGGIAYFVKRLSTPVETYHHTMPVPSGTDGGTTTDTTTGTTTGTTTDENIDLRAGAPTTTT